MAEYPQPDLMDEGGRLRRLVLALIVGSALAITTYGVARHLVDADNQMDPNDPGYSQRHVRGGERFVFYFTGIAGAAGFVLTLGTLNARAKKKWMESRDVPEAKQVS